MQDGTEFYCSEDCKEITYCLANNPKCMYYDKKGNIERKKKLADERRRSKNSRIEFFIPFTENLYRLLLTCDVSHIRTLGYIKNLKLKKPVNINGLAVHPQQLYPRDVEDVWLHGVEKIGGFSRWYPEEKGIMDIQVSFPITSPELRGMYEPTSNKKFYILLNMCNSYHRSIENSIKAIKAVNRMKRKYPQWYGSSLQRPVR